MPNYNTPQNDSIMIKDRYLTWLKQSKYDLAAAFLSLENEYFEWAVYQAEQAVEKALKAVIVHAGQRPPKIHKLSILFGFCNQINSEFKNTKFNFKHVEAFTFISRYPFLIPDGNKTPHELITEKDAGKSLSEASEILLSITRILKVPRVKPEEISEIVFKTKFYTFEEIKKRIEKIKEQLTKEFEPIQIILFGRYARDYGKPTPGTMDLLIITECKECSFIERIYRAREATKGTEPIIEPLVYTPEEIRLLQDKDEAFLKSAFQEGRIIYSKNQTS